MLPHTKTSSQINWKIVLPIGFSSCSSYMACILVTPKCSLFFKYALIAYFHSIWFSSDLCISTCCYDAISCISLICMSPTVQTAYFLFCATICTYLYMRTFHFALNCTNLHTSHVYCLLRSEPYILGISLLWLRVWMKIDIQKYLVNMT